MGTALWIAQGVLAVAFLVAGSMKAFKDYAALNADPHMAFTNDFSKGFIRFLGWSEMAAAVGLVLPGLTGIAPMLTPLAAGGLVVLMIGAVGVHLRRSEPKLIFVPLSLSATAVFVVYGHIVL